MGSSFWNFSLAVYGASAVQDECLKLQDQFGLDVNLILLCAFLGAVHNTTLTADDIAAARQEVQQWQEQIVLPLRAARRHLKTVELTDTEDAPAVAHLRARVKAAELESERIEQTILERWAAARLKGRPQDEKHVAVIANLQTLLGEYGVTRERLDAAQAMWHLIASALARVP